ncbi:unnamed protein product [Ilex paraguariensis]|uniref:Uncharacterized protein n=1 Tax=Ilex paraguariensis TaxID=185542 RepID=A0ABC8TZY5_9AQUA
MRTTSDRFEVKWELVTNLFDPEWLINSFQRRSSCIQGLLPKVILQMKIWNTSAAKQGELSKMLDEWAVHIRRKYGHKQLSSSIYLSEAEPFLEQYAKRSPHNQALIGSAGNLVRAEDFLAIVEEGRDEEGDLEIEKGLAPSSPSRLIKDSVLKDEGLIVFFPGIPGCAKSALCKEILSSPGGLGDDRPVHSLMGDLIKGRYWQKVADERRRKPYSIMLADKNAPNEEVWRQASEDVSGIEGSHLVSGNPEATQSILPIPSICEIKYLAPDRVAVPIITNRAPLVKLEAKNGISWCEYGQSWPCLWGMFF